MSSSLAQKSISSGDMTPSSAALSINSHLSALRFDVGVLPIILVSSCS
jgi:hypothetical protein